MFSKKYMKGLTLAALSALFSLSTIQSAWARPGTLATAPLFLSSIVQPNVFFTHDDSGSMFWEQMVATGTGGFISSSGLPLIGNSYRYYLHPDWHTDSRVLPPVALFPNSWIFRNHNGNKAYFNPNEEYPAWSGTDINGNPMYKTFEAADATAAPRYPNDPGGTKTDLTARIDFFDYDFCNCWVNNAIYLPTYYIWDDTDGDGVIEPTDGNTRVEIQPGTEMMKKFVNWFVYYRKREYAAKSAIGRVINNTDASRMGLDVFNRGHQKDAKTMSDPTNKRELLETFYRQVYSSGGTPARNALRRVGEFFRSTGANAPILDANNGGECQQNFNILLSDGFWNGSNPTGIGNEDADTGGALDSIFDGTRTQSNDGGHYADNHSRTLADVAMYYYENDLRTLANRVRPVTDGPVKDFATHQHLVTYSIAFGLTGTLDSTVDDPTDPAFTWPNAHAGDPQKVDDMWHAAYNGRGLHLSAQSPQALEAALDAAIADIEQRTATAAAVSVNSTQLTTDTVVYLAEFSTNRWQGNMKAFKIKTDGNGNLDPTGELEASPEWEASAAVSSQDPDDRVIMTYDGSKGIPFRWDTANGTQLTALQQADLMTAPSGALETSAEGIERLEYLRGDQTFDGTKYRDRLSLLGDLVNSGPVYVGPPALNWPDRDPFPTSPGQRYSDYKNGPDANRDGVIYAAANDGMLHGFSEIDGTEKLAYIPLNLFSTNPGEGMHYLTDSNYQHRYYNDLTPTLSDIYADLGQGTKWQTVLINGQRGGGRGIYALNVNDPNAFTEANAADVVLWEFSDADDPDLGHTFSRPQIALTNENNNARWVAIFGNGYNDSGDGEAKLFILDIAGGAIDGTWDAADVIEISTGVGTPADRNGLSTPTLADLDGNGTVDRVYAGDLYGNMWAFDLSSSNPNLWGVVNNEPLFTTPNAQPITVAPVLAKHPTLSDDGTTDPNVMVYFGTGQYLTNGDKTTLPTEPSNHFYGIWDRADDDPTPYPLGHGDLVQQFYLNGFTDDNGDPVRVLSDNQVNYQGGDMGWFFELDEVGEKVIFRPVLRGGIVFFTTFIPNPDPCGEGGSNFFFSVDMVDGSSPDDPEVDTNGDGIIDDNDRVSNGSVTGVMAARKSEGLAPNPVFVDDIAYTGAKPTKVKKLKKIPTGRFSWQELLQ